VQVLVTNDDGIESPGLAVLVAAATRAGHRVTVAAPSLAPTASFTAAPTSGSAPLAVQFTDTSSGTPTQWLWDFGDGATSTERNPGHTYTAAGTYSVALTAANAAGSDTQTQTGSITVSPGSIGFRGPATNGAGSAPTGEKPESKLWWNDGSWWGVLFDTVSRTHHIFRLDRASQTWIDTTTLVDGRASSRADVLWDGHALYVASHVFASSNTAATAGQPARLSRYSYNSATRTYSLDAGFPVAISDYSSETLTIDKDSTGTLWASWAQANRVYVNRSVGGDATWGTPFPLAVNGADSLESDDNPAVVAFGGGGIGGCGATRRRRPRSTAPTACPPPPGSNSAAGLAAWLGRFLRRAPAGCCASTGPPCAPDRGVGWSDAADDRAARCCERPIRSCSMTTARRRRDGLTSFPG